MVNYAATVSEVMHILIITLKLVIIHSYHMYCHFITCNFLIITHKYPVMQTNFYFFTYISHFSVFQEETLAAETLVETDEEETSIKYGYPLVIQTLQ